MAKQQTVLLQVIMCSARAEWYALWRCRLKAVKKQHSGLVAIGRRSLNAHAAVLVAKKKMGRFIIRRSDISGLGVFTLGATL